MCDSTRLRQAHARQLSGESPFYLQIESLTQSICDFKMRFGEADDEDGEGGKKKKKRMGRPFGVSMLVAGMDRKGPQLFHTDPSGTYVAYKAHAIGNGSETALNALQEKYHASMTLLEAQQLVMRILADVMEERPTLENVDMATVTPTGDDAVGQYRMLEKSELSELIDTVQEARAAEEGGNAAS